MVTIEGDHVTARQGLIVAERMNAVGFSEIVKIRNQILDMRARGEEVFQFEGGEPFSSTPQFIKDACTRALAEDKTRYAPSSGIAPLLEVLAEKLKVKNGIAAKPSDVIVVNGGMQGLFGAFESTINPGDEVLMFSPYWTPIRDLVRLTGGEIVLVDTQAALAQGFKAAIEKKVSPKTRCIYVNTPQNPTGVVFGRAELEAIADVAKKENLVVISDEAYEDLTYDVPHVSIMSFPGMFERTISTYTFSKTYAMTGWRLGYAVAPEPFMSGLKKITLTSSNGVSTPTQWAGVAAVKDGNGFIEECRVEYRKRRDLLCAALNDAGLVCAPPRGAFFAFADARRFGTDSWKIAADLLSRAKVACLPGAIFGPEGEGHLRFSFSTSIETIERGAEALKKALKSASNRS